jgi:hypothetical protein
VRDGGAGCTTGGLAAQETADFLVFFRKERRRRTPAGLLGREPQVDAALQQRSIP